LYFQPLTFVIFVPYLLIFGCQGGGVNKFVLIVHFLNDKWEPCHVTIGFCEIVDTSRSAMALQMNDVTTLALGSLSKKGLAKVRAISKI
jgi:hypothetical protein